MAGNPQHGFHGRSEARVSILFVVVIAVAVLAVVIVMLWATAQVSGAGPAGAS